jgi:O-acetyl-ADP-ribose deacetylase (regulator of RNase III)
MIELVLGNIVFEEVDAIVNAANSGLMGGGGVDGAIHRAGGPRILEECKVIVARQERCATGHAVITGAGNLKAKYVIHAVGPRYGRDPAREAELLASAYREAIRLAAEAGCTTIAFPAISTGAYGYPLDEAASIAIRTIRSALEQAPTIRRVRLVLFDQQALRAFDRALKAPT